MNTKEGKDVLELARNYATQGFSVIPIKPAEKVPAMPWKEFHGRRPSGCEIQQWFGNGNKPNIGIVTGKVSGIIVADFDTEKAYRIALEKGLPETPTVKTARGYHCYFKFREGIVSSKGPGYDIKSNGGYVLAPPSVHPSGHIYEWVNNKSLFDLPLADFPDHLFLADQTQKTALSELYQGTAEGSRNINLTKIAGSLANDKLSLPECLAVIDAINQRNTPPLAQREVEAIARSIYDKHNGKSPKLVLLKWNDVQYLDVKTEYLLDRLIPKQGITLLFGRGGIGKSSLCLQIAHAIGNGIPFDNIQTIKMPVYYIDFENPLTCLKERISNIGLSDNVSIWHISNETPPPRLDSSDWVLYKQLPAGLLIFDTLRASNLSDENDSRQMAVVIARLKELREMGFTILLLHHTPKANENTYKGSTAILDLVDNVIGLEEAKEHGV